MKDQEEKIKIWLLTHVGIESEYNRNLIYNTLCKPRKLTSAEVFQWLNDQKYQTEQGDQEYKMYFDVDMPKIINTAINELNIVSL